MNRNSLLHKNIWQTGICVLLCTVMLLGLVLPGMDMTHSHPDNPLENEAIREISILKVSDNVEELDDIVVPNQDTDAGDWGSDRQFHAPFIMETAGTVPVVRIPYRPLGFVPAIFTTEMERRLSLNARGFFNIITSFVMG